MGIEPTSSAWKAEALPLCYTRVMTRIYCNPSLRSCNIMDVQKKVTLAPGAWRLTEQTGSGFPAETRRLDYQSPADGLDDWALLKMPAPGVSTWLVCIHGHGSRGNQLYIRPDLQKLWLPRYLERGYGILTPNLRGNAWMGPAAVTDMDALLHFLRTQCQAKKFLFESGSMGGTSNLIYAGLRPENVAGVSARGAVIDLTAYHAFCRSRAEVGLLQTAARQRNSQRSIRPIRRSTTRIKCRTCRFFWLTALLTRLCQSARPALLPQRWRRTLVLSMSRFPAAGMIRR